MDEAIRKALLDALEEHGVYEEDVNLEIERPRDPSHGDLTTNVALVLAKRLDRKPRELAGELAANLVLDEEQVESLEIAGPGFINFRFTHRFLLERLRGILEAAAAFGRSQAGEGQRVHLEFISANPTGPLNIVSARAAAVGSALARTLAAAGFRPHSEFYVNDSGRQVELLGLSLRARYAEVAGVEGVELPEEGYRGEYLLELARGLKERGPEVPEGLDEATAGRFLGELPAVVGGPAEWMALEETESARAFGRYGLRALLAEQRRACLRFGVTFDTWYLESRLHEENRIGSTLERLRESGKVYEEDGAVWFRSTDYGDEKDRVLVKKDGSSTYFLADIAYHASKRERGCDHAIDFWGPDHHGYIPRMQAAMQALGLSEDWLEVVMLQQVNLLMEGKPVEMSKRAGRLVTLEQLIDEVGADVAKFFFLARKNNSHLDFDLDLAKAESSDNPAWYVKYAHARICSVLRNAETRGVDAETLEEGDLELLTDEPEVALLRLLPALTETVVRAALSREISRLTSFAVEVAAAFHHFYQQCTILGDDPAPSRARLALARATRIVLANTLALVGVEAPERM